MEDCSPLQVTGVEELSAKTSQLFCSGNLQMKATSQICTSTGVKHDAHAYF